MEFILATEDANVWDEIEVPLTINNFFFINSSMRKKFGTNWLNNMSLAVVHRLTRIYCIGLTDSHEIEDGSMTKLSKSHWHCIIIIIIIIKKGW